MKTKYLAFILIALISCNHKSNSNYSKTEQNGESIYNVNSEDEDMNLAIIKAKSTLASFDSALASNNNNFYNFSLKVKFTEGDENEHIWFSGVKKNGNSYIGIVDNEPIYITTIKLGDTLVIDNDNISDWQYFNKNKIIGSFTTKALRKHMSEEEKEKFDKESQNAYLD